MGQHKMGQRMPESHSRFFSLVGLDLERSSNPARSQESDGKIGSAGQGVSDSCRQPMQQGAAKKCLSFTHFFHFKSVRHQIFADDLGQEKIKQSRCQWKISSGSLQSCLGSTHM
jgi:hypothetical protein